MADVTGNIGSESVRLRGMAMEDTQYLILKELEDLTKVMGVIKDTNKTNAQRKKDEDQAVVDANNRLAKILGALGKGAGLAGDALGTVYKGAETLVKKLDVLGASLVDNKFIGLMRGMSDNVGDVSYSMRQLAIASRGTVGAIMKFGADSADQRQREFEVYKKMSAIGGAFATDFGSLQIQAAKMGLTMEQMAATLESNINNLRFGGRGARNALRDLGEEVGKLLENDGMVFRFAQMGVDAKDYSKVILQQTSVMGGLTNAQRKYGTDFGNVMLRMTENSARLADVFGFNRDQMLADSNKIGQDAVFKNYFKNLKIDDTVKGAVVNMITGMFGGDQGLAEKAIVAAIHPQRLYMDNTLGLMETLVAGRGGPSIFGAIRKYTEAMTEAGSDVNKQFEAVQKHLKPFAKEFENFASDPNNAVILLSNPELRKAFTALSGILQSLPQSARDMANFNNTLENKNLSEEEKRNLRRLEEFALMSKTNIQLAVTSAMVNQHLNDLGMGVASLTQMLALSGTALGLGFGQQLGSNPEFQDVMRQMRDLKQKGMDNLSRFTDPSQAPAAAARLYREFETDITQRARDAESTRRNVPLTPVPGSQGTLPDPASFDPGKSINVRDKDNRRVISIDPRRINEADARKLEAFGGGPVNTAIQQVMQLLTNSSIGEGLLYTGGNDRYHQGLDYVSRHTQGLALDMVIPGGGSNEQYENLTRNINSMLADLSPGAVAEYHPKGFKGSTGNHIHLSFPSQTAADNFAKKFNERYGGANRQGAAMGTGNAASALASASSGAGSAVAPEGNVAAVYAQQSSQDTGPVNAGTISNTSASVVVVSLDQPSVNAIVDGFKRSMSGIDTAANAAAKNGWMSQFALTGPRSA